ncbi:MAG: M36 family metallopeptidase, partial [Bacteroidota bacterium]
MKHPSTLLVILFFLFSNFLQSQVKAPTAVAKQYLATQHQQLQLTESDIEDYEVRSVVVSKHNKLTHVYLRQQHAGIPVQNAIFNLNITADGQVVSFGNRFEAKLAERVNATRPQLSMQDAIVATLDHFKIPYTTIPALVEQKNAQEATFDPSEVALTPIKVRLRYQPLPNKEVRLAWQVMVEELNGNHAWSVQVDALTGELLDTYDMVLHCSFGGTPKYFAGIHASHLQHNRTYDNTGLAPETPWANPILAITTAGEAAYNVYPVPVESPNHGDRALVINPADTISSPFGWHDTDGFEGAEYTITRGNNVHAYHDIFDIDNSSGDEPDGGDSLVFDFPLDLSTNKPYTQQEPLITNLFYWNNIMHDVWYQYGFDEAAGNFQETNYTGEGLGGDHVRAQALDGRGVNNANFLTRDEGDSVRMQMFVWGNNINLEGIGPTNTFNVTTPDSLAGSYPFAAATFGDPLPPVEEAITGKVVLMDDGVGEPFDGCEPLLNAEELDGNIALVFRRDGCQDAFRVLAAQEAGAIAVMVCNSSFGDLLNMGPGSFGDQVT